MVTFAGKDFLSMRPPPGYVAGAGRGAVPLSTSRRAPPPPARLKRAAAQPAADPDRLVDADEDEDVYDAIEQKRRRRRPPAAKSLNQPQNAKPESAKPQIGKPEIAFEEWVRLPAAADSTRRNKRLREQTQQTQRFYAASAKLALTQQDVRLAELERQKAMLLRKIDAAPSSDERAYVQLADAELELEGIPAARAAVLRGIKHCSSGSGGGEKLWLKLLDLHESVGSAECARITTRALAKLPRSEPLWLRRVALAPTRAEKLLLVHEALIQCTRSSELWRLAAELEDDEETRRRVRETASRFVGAPGAAAGADAEAAEAAGADAADNATEAAAAADTADATDAAAAADTTDTADTADTTAAAAAAAAAAAFETELLGKPLIVRRALLSRKTTESPECVDLWILRIKTELSDNKPVQHIISAALKHHPDNAELWVLDLQSTEPTRVKARIAEALKMSNGAVPVLRFGAEYFRAQGNIALAEKWEKRAAQEH